MLPLNNSIKWFRQIISIIWKVVLKVGARSLFQSGLVPPSTILLKSFRMRWAESHISVSYLVLRRCYFEQSSCSCVHRLRLHPLGKQFTHSGFEIKKVKSLTFSFLYAASTTIFMGRFGTIPCYMYDIGASSSTFLYTYASVLFMDLLQKLKFGICFYTTCR